MKATWVKPALSIVLSAFLIGLSFYVEEVRRLPIWIQIALFLVLASASTLVLQVWDKANEILANERLRSRNRQLRLRAREASGTLTSLQQVLVRFFDNSEIYRKKVSTVLGFEEEYLCIIKSSEGLSAVFKALPAQEHEMLPFGAVLSRIPGAVQPFERIALFLIPIRSLPGFTPTDIKSYMQKEIIPLVVEERARYLSTLPAKFAKLADEFSYKYLAFLLRKESVTYDSTNRKFREEFARFIISEQSQEHLGRMKEELQEMIKTKDIVNLVDWARLVDLNRDQSAFVELHRADLNSRLISSGFLLLTDFESKSESEFLEAIWPVCRRRISRRRASNLASKAVAGVRAAVASLRTAGMSL